VVWVVVVQETWREGTLTDLDVRYTNAGPFAAVSGEKLVR
jgi:hypothetical protein